MDPKLTNINSNLLWNSDSTRIILQQLIEVIRKVDSIELDLELDQKRFCFESGKKNKRKGFQSVLGEYTENSTIRIQIELVRASNKIRVDAGIFFKYLSELSDKIHLIAPDYSSKNNDSSLWVEFYIQAVPLTISRSGVLISELKGLYQLSIFLQEQVPEIQVIPELMDQYKDVSDILDPVLPLKPQLFSECREIQLWGQQVLDYLQGSLSLAIISEFSIVDQFFLAYIADLIKKLQSTIGKIKLPAINMKMLIDIVGKAPGIVTVSANRINIGSNIYEISNESQNILNILSTMMKPAIFTGSYSELQELFHGGQGGKNDPFMPVVVHVPHAPIKDLIYFVIENQSKKAGGLSIADFNQVSDKVYEITKKIDYAQICKILPALVSYQIKNRDYNEKNSDIPYFIKNIKQKRETLAGLSNQRKRNRMESIQNDFAEKLLQPGLKNFLTQTIIAQDHAIEELVNRLKTEVLTRPLYQPIRYCAQGTPGTGKSESAVLLSKWLEIPYINIDAASIPDFYTGSAQLLGSGRGIVGSHKSGRLEQASKHYSGVVVEISDLDHTVAHVRASLADLFLQVLETGEAQSASGTMFSCSNIIFVFTINLPGGLDEKIRNGFGFNSNPCPKDIKQNVNKEIKGMFSNAFLSRIGNPILFEPLKGESLAKILEKGLQTSFYSAFERMNIEIAELNIEKNIGLKIISGLESNFISFGARYLIDLSRNLASNALIEFMNQNKERKNCHINAFWDNDKNLKLKLLERMENYDRSGF